MSVAYVNLLQREKNREKTVKKMAKKSELKGEKDCPELTDTEEEEVPKQTVRTAFPFSQKKNTERELFFFLRTSRWVERCRRFVQNWGS